MAVRLALRLPSSLTKESEAILHCSLLSCHCLPVWLAHHMMLILLVIRSVRNVDRVLAAMLRGESSPTNTHNSTILRERFNRRSLHSGTLISLKYEVWP